MKTRYLSFLLIFILYSFEINAQTENDQFSVLDGPTPEEKMLLASNNLLMNLPFEESVLRYRAGNSVFIQQVGQNNDVNTSILSSDALVNLIQDGNDNYMQLNIRATQIRENVNQTGNSNRFFDFVDSTVKQNHLDLQQSGNNNLVIKYGANSISNKISYRVDGNYKTLIIKNFP